MYHIERVNSITSTNEVCMKLGHNGMEKHYVLVANEQTEGRGRLGREWHSEANAGIYLSVLERPEMNVDRAPMLSIVMGLAARTAMEEVFEMKCQLKWPNDVVYQGKKVAGILAQMQMRESQIDYVVIGIGINLFHSVFPKELQEKATSVYLEGYCKKNDENTKEKLIESLVKNWKAYYDKFLKEQSLTSFLQEYEKYLVNKEKEVVVHDAGGEFCGIARGISEEGELIVETDCEVRRISSGEVSVRGVYGYV